MFTVPSKTVTRSVAIFVASLPFVVKADVFSNVPEATTDGYQLVYSLAISQANASYNTTAIPYTTDLSANFPAGSFDRVAYYVELSGSTDATRPNGYVYASFDKPAVFVDGGDIGVPSNGPNGSGIVTNTAVANMHVFSNATGTPASISTGTFATGGKLEFWPSNYGAGANAAFDYDDDGFNNSSGHGSMQIHNTSIPQTLFGYSDWGGNTPAGPASEIGIGTNTGNGSPDWTFSDSGTTYTARTLEILVHPVPEPAALSLLSVGGLLALARRRH